MTECYRKLTNKKIIAIDFDGTITEDSSFPITGKIRPQAVEVIKKLQEKYTCVLWTCRSGDALSEAISLLNKSGLVFEYVNESPVNINSRKIYADVYIDDKNVVNGVDWDFIKSKLL